MEINYFLLELKTRSPIIEVAALSTMMPYIPVPIHITSDEPLGDWQDVYFLDAADNRFDVSVTVAEDRMSADGILWAEAAEGIGVLYAQLADDVDNRSNIVEVAINCVGVGRKYCLHIDLHKPYEIKQAWHVIYKLPLDYKIKYQLRQSIAAQRYSARLAVTANVPKISAVACAHEGGGNRGN